jgi:hypothetical protein
MHKAPANEEKEKGRRIVIMHENQALGLYHFTILHSEILPFQVQYTVGWKMELCS